MQIKKPINSNLKEMRITTMRGVESQHLASEQELPNNLFGSTCHLQIFTLGLRNHVGRSIPN